MKHRLMAAFSTALVLALTGCGDGSQEGDAKDQGTAMDAVKEKAQAAMDSANEAGKQAMEAASGAAEVAKEKGAEMVSEGQAQAQALIDQAKAYLAENNITSAQDVLDKLAELKTYLPEAIQTQIDNLEAKIAEMRAKDADAPAADTPASE